MVTRRILNFFVFFCLFCAMLSAQVIEPIKWNKKVQENKDGTYSIIFQANIEDGWHLYSTKHKKGGIGIPTDFNFKKSSDYKLIGSIEEKGKLHNDFNEIFEEQQMYFSGNTTFTQKIEVKKSTKIEVEVMFQVCDDQKCLPPDYKTFTFDLKPLTLAKEEKAKEIEEKAETEMDSTKIHQYTVISSPVKELEKEPTVSSESITEEEIDKSSDRSLLDIFIFGFLGGFAALLMPCIFPMIPLTVSMFTKQKSGIAKAFVYGLSIIIIYVSLGMIITQIFGPSALNELATDPRVNVIFFILFILFALSFFGAFEITLPSKWINKTDKAADKGGFIGIFFMAMTLVLVSFSCTGPIIGTLLVDSVSSGAKLGPAIGMFGFSLALALPFTLFALFPSWLNSLPKSGSWLNTVKVSLGFIELAFAMKFLSNADIVLRLHLLERELFLSIWIGIFLTLAFYLFNIFRMETDGNKGIGWIRMTFGILSLSFSIYMIGGLFGAPLKILSGLIPPKIYSELPMGIGGEKANSVELPEHAEYGPNQIPVFHDIEHAFDYAEKVNKPVMLDFTGDACANCRLVEDKIWIDSRIKEKLTNDVVLVSLYVDRFVDLPKEEQVFSPEKGRNLRTIGDKWSAFQIKHFKSNSQPLYIMIDREMNHYTKPIGSELNVEEYLKWIEDGVNNFKNKN